MTVTPLAKRPMMSRNSFGSRRRRSAGASWDFVSTLMTRTPLFEPEPDLDGDLEVGDLPLVQMAPNSHDLEPLEVAKRLARLGDGRAHRVVDPLRRRPGHLDAFVHVIAHQVLSSVVLRDGRRSPDAGLEAAEQMPHPP